MKGDPKRLLVTSSYFTNWYGGSSDQNAELSCEPATPFLIMCPKNTGEYITKTLEHSSLLQQDAQQLS